jgi:transposase
LHDVSTLITTVKQSSFLQNRHLKLVLDRGFYSKKNINYMSFSEYKSDFIIGLPATTTIYNDLVEEHSYIFENISYAFHYKGKTIFATTKKIKPYDNISLYAHIFSDPSKVDANRDIIVDEITTMYNNAMSDPLSYINDPDYRYALTFRKSSKQPNGYIIKKNNDSYKDFRTRDGWFILISNCEKDPIQTLKIYRNRDVVEKAFDLIKHFLRKKRTYVHNDECYENTILITFICMVLISIIHNVMTENDLYKNKTMEEFLLELSSHKAVIIDNNYIIDPLTKTLKNYFDLFNCPYPDK